MRRRSEVSRAVREVALATRVPPQTESELRIVQVLSEMLELPDDEISVDETIFELGVTSLGLFRFEQSLRKHLRIGLGISIITFLSNPTIKSIANAIDNQHSRQYDPVVQLQARGIRLSFGPYILRLATFLRFDLLLEQSETGSYLR